MYFFCTFFKLLINTLLMILFMRKKNVFSKEIFFVSRLTATHDLWPRHATDTWLRIKKILHVVDICVNFKILRHLVDITTCQQHVDDISN